MKWIELVILLISNCGYIFSQTFTIVRGNAEGICMTNLMNGLANDAFSSSSYKENNYPYYARAVLHSNQTSVDAWCPGKPVGPDTNEWIQVTFDGLKMISSIFMLGLDSGNIGFFVPFFYFDYQRESDSVWHRYRNLDNNEVLEGNVDSRNSIVKRFPFNIVVKRIRIIPVVNSTVSVCLKFNLYGCDFNDGVVEYSIPQGNTFTYLSDQKYQLIDKTYDKIDRKSILIPGIWLRGGLGQLMDNRINTNTIQSASSDNFNFVGWHRNRTNSTVVMVFRFDRVRTMKSIRFHILNNYQNNISVFASVKFEFSIGGEMYGIRARDIEFVHDTDTLVMQSRWVTVNLNDSAAKYLRVSMKFRLDWIVLTEVNITTDVLHGFVAVEPSKNGVTMINTVPPSDDRIDAATKMNYLLPLFGVLIALALLLIVLIFFILRLRRHRKRRFKGKTNPSILYGNMPCNNVIPIPVITNNNGGFYKPIPNGMYDCMLPYQSQTLNVRKVTGYPVQASQQQQHQQFGTYNNRCNGTSNTNTMLNGIIKDNYNATLSPIVGQQCFSQNINTHFPENKRASFDGSYAGTGSNPDYSNPSIIKESIAAENPYNTMHLMTMSPVLYGQFNCSNNDNQIGQYQVRIPYNVLYATENPPLDPSTVVWAEVLSDICNKHCSYESVLQSPVGGSMIIRQNNDIGALGSVDDYEKEISNRLLPIDSFQIDIQTIIGSGKYGSLYKGIYNGSPVVVKSMDKNCPLSVRQSFLRTISDLMKLSNKNMAGMIGYCSYNNNSESLRDFSDLIAKPTINCIVTEHSRYTDLHTFIRMFSRTSLNNRRNSSLHQKTGSDTSSTSVEDETDKNLNKSMLSQSCLIYLASQISNGMSYLEQEQLVHRDLAARNCLLGPRLSVFITDTALDNKDFQDHYVAVTEVMDNLGSAGLINVTIETRQNINIPLCWMSWEAVLKAEYTIKSDIWSFGVVLWEILTNCQFRPYYTVPQNSSNLEFMDLKNVKCLSLIHNFKCLALSSDNALLPNNESLNEIRKVSSWMSPLPLPVPPLLINNHNCLTTPRTKPVIGAYIPDCSSNQILNTNREMRDLIESCWLIEPNLRPNFRDINRFLYQKINGFNADEEYQMLQLGLSKKVDDTYVPR